MGLDQYLRARTNSIKHKSSRGACGGMFPIAPADRGTTEIGYWRKAYAVSDYLRQVLEIYDDFNLEDKEISYNKVLEIIDYANKKLERKSFENEYEMRDWQDTVEAFTKAKQILENDPDAKFIIWSGIDMKEYKAMAHINSLKGEMAEITVLEKVGDNDYIVDYKGVKCHALFNWFVCEYYADDIYGRVEQ